MTRGGLVLLLTLALSAAQVEARVISIADVATLTGLGSVAISPDGSRIAYVTTKGKVSRLWIRPFVSGNPSLLSSSKDDDFAPLAWSPDGKMLSFSDAVAGRSRIVLWSASEKRITFLPRDLQGSVQWFPDSSRLLLKRVVDSAPAPAPSSTPGVTVFVSPTQPPIASKPTDELVSFDVRTGSIAPIAREIPADSYRLSPDGTKVLYVVHKGEVAGDVVRSIYDVYVIDLATGKQTGVARSILLESSDLLRWSPNGSKIAFAGGTLSHDAGVPRVDYQGYHYPAWCYVIDVRTGELRRIGVQVFSRFRSVRWSSDGETIYAVLANEAGLDAVSVSSGTSMPVIPGDYMIVGPMADSGPYRFDVAVQTGQGPAIVYRVDDLSGRATVVISETASIGPLEFSRDGTRCVFGREDVSHPLDLWAANADFSSRRQLTTLNPQTVTWSLSSLQKTVKWRSREGYTLYGVVLLPLNYIPGKRYPLLTNIYPDQKLGTDNRNNFGMAGMTDGGNDFINMQLYTSRGYAVFMPDSRARVGHPMQDLVGSILPGVDRVVAMGIADPNRLGIWGGSYGGYGTIATITQTRRFKAAVSYLGASDLITQYGVMSPGGGDSTFWAESSQGKLGGTPWQYRNRYLENSPFFYLDRVRTPILLEYGEDDYSWSKFGSPQTFIALRRLGKTATLVAYANEAHGVSNLAHEVDFFNRILAWFRKYLK